MHYLDFATSGEYALHIVNDAAMKDDATMIFEMKLGRFDGADLSAVGLATFEPNAFVLSLPGLAGGESGFARVVSAVGPEIEQGITRAGYLLGGWIDAGALHVFSRLFEFRGPYQLRGARVALRARDPVQAALHAAIEGTQAPLIVRPKELLPLLTSGQVDAVVATAADVDRFGWQGYIERVNDLELNHDVGALVFSSSLLESLPADLREMFLNGARRSSQNLSSQAHADGVDEYERFSAGLTHFEPNEPQRLQWEAVKRRAIEVLARGTLDRSLVDRALAARGLPRLSH